MGKKKSIKWKAAKGSLKKKKTTVFFVLVLLVEELGSSTGLQGKNSTGACMGDCGVARQFISLEIERAPPGFPMSHVCLSHQGKSPTVSSSRQKRRLMSRMSIACFIFNLSPLEPTQSVDYGCFSTPMVTCFWARENMNEMGECESVGHEWQWGERERVPGVLSRSFFSSQSTCQAFMGAPPSPCSLSQDRLTSLYGQAPALQHFTSIRHVSTSLCSSFPLIIL